MTLVVTREGNILEQRIVRGTLDKVVNLFRFDSIYHPLPCYWFSNSLYNRKTTIDVRSDCSASIRNRSISLVKYISLTEVDKEIYRSRVKHGIHRFRNYLRVCRETPSLIPQSSLTIIKQWFNNHGRALAPGVGCVNLTGYNRFQGDISWDHNYHVVIVFIRQAIGDYLESH